MLPFLTDHHGDPARLHAEGRATRIAVEDAREQVATLFGARPREVVFTANGTESVNHAIWGGIRRAGLGGAVVTTAVEHSSVLDACRREAGPVTVVGVDAGGRFDADEVSAAITEETALVTVQLANHEVGTLQPVAAVCAAARERDVLVHVDACTAAGHVPVDFGGLGADLLSVTAHKLGGPKGVGALLIRRGLRIPPLIIGGAQERERRGGLENVPAIVGFGAAAAELLDGDRLALEAEVTRRVTEAIAAGALERVERVVRYGDPDDRVPHILCLGIEGVEAEPILLALDQQRRRGALGIGVLERGARALARARGHGRRRRPLAACQRRAGRPPTPTPRTSSTCCRVSSRRSAPSAPTDPHHAAPKGTPMSQDWNDLSARLTSSLSLAAAPIGITFRAEPVAGVDGFDRPMPDPMPDGRTGRVPAGCVFWMHATESTFNTVAEDHGNCSVGSLTHGFKTLDEVAGNGDVAALLDTGWVTMDVVPQIPVVTEKPGAVVYGPLAGSPVDPDVVLLRLNAKQLMVVSDAVPGLRIEGKPQCHIVAIAKEQGEIAASVGCALSRVRTGMPATETTCAIPGSKVEDVVTAIEKNAVADTAVARYAAEDATRFA